MCSEFISSPIRSWKTHGSYQWMCKHIAYDSASISKLKLHWKFLLGCFDCKQMYNHTNTCIPAQISSKDVEQLVSVYQRVKDCAVRTVDHVALIGRPPWHLPVNLKTSISAWCRSSAVHKCNLEALVHECFHCILLQLHYNSVRILFFCFFFKFNFSVTVTNSLSD